MIIPLIQVIFRWYEGETRLATKADREREDREGKRCAFYNIVGIVGFCFWDAYKSPYIIYITIGLIAAFWLWGPWKERAAIKPQAVPPRHSD